MSTGMVQELQVHALYISVCLALTLMFTYVKCPMSIFINISVSINFLAPFTLSS